MTAAPAALLILILSSAIGEGLGQKRRSSPPTASQIVDFDCPEEFGYYAHPGDCTQYYVCVFGGALLESCTGGLMYSHELQTCDWPRNVGCGEATQVSSSISQASEVRGRQSVSRGSQQAREQPAPKHDLYTEEELGPAEEIETDRQQRVYRGQPPTIGQVASDRDALSTHSNAIPQVPTSGGRDKLSVVSYGAQQQYNSFDLLTNLGDLRPDNSDHNFVTNMKSRVKRQTLPSHQGGRDLGTNFNGRLPSWTSFQSHPPQSFMFNSQNGRLIASILSPPNPSHSKVNRHSQNLDSGKIPVDEFHYSDGQPSRAKQKNVNSVGFTFGPGDAKINTNGVPFKTNMNNFAQPQVRPTSTTWVSARPLETGFTQSLSTKPKPFSVRNLNPTHVQDKTNGKNQSFDIYNNLFLTLVTPPTVAPTRPQLYRLSRPTDLPVTFSDSIGTYTKNLNTHNKQQNQKGTTKNADANNKSDLSAGSSESESKSKEDDEKSNESGFVHGGFYEQNFPAPPVEFTREHVVSFEDTNPFSDPNFDFDKFLSSIRSHPTILVQTTSPSALNNKFLSTTPVYYFGDQFIPSNKPLTNSPFNSKGKYLNHETSKPVPRFQNVNSNPSSKYGTNLNEYQSRAPRISSQNSSIRLEQSKDTAAKTKPNKNLSSHDKEEYYDDEEIDSEEYDDYDEERNYDDEDEEEEEEDEGENEEEEEGEDEDVEDRGTIPYSSSKETYNNHRYTNPPMRGFQQGSTKNAVKVTTPDYRTHESNVPNPRAIHYKHPLQKDLCLNGNNRRLYRYKQICGNTHQDEKSQLGNSNHNTKLNKNENFSHGDKQSTVANPNFSKSTSLHFQYYMTPDISIDIKNGKTTVTTTENPHKSQHVRPPPQKGTFQKPSTFSAQGFVKKDNENLESDLAYSKRLTNHRINSSQYSLQDSLLQNTTSNPKMHHRKTQRQRPNINGQIKPSDRDMNDYYSKAFTQRTLTQIRASVSPQQAYIETVTAPPSRNYNASQYIAQQYDPYYTLYDDEADLYKDIDYTQYTTGQGTQNQRYRGQSAYKERKPTVEIVQQEPIQRGVSYSKNKYNSQQDLYQPSISQQDYESYSIQTNDDIQYRQPIQSKQPARLAPNRGTEGTLGKKEEKVSALPEGVERNPTLGTHRISLTARYSHQDNPSSSQPSSKVTTSKTVTESTNRSRQTTTTESTPLNYVTRSVSPATQKNKEISDAPKTEKLIQSRRSFVIQVTTAEPLAKRKESSSAYDLIKSFLDEQARNGPAPQPFRPRAESGRESTTSRSSPAYEGRGHFIVTNTDRRESVERTSDLVTSSPVRVDDSDVRISGVRGHTNIDYSNSRKPLVNRVPIRNYDEENAKNVPRPISIEDGSSEQKTTTLKPKSQIVEQYSITSKPLQPRHNLETVTTRTQYQIHDSSRGNSRNIEVTTRRPSRLTPNLAAIVQEYTITRRPTTTSRGSANPDANTHYSNSSPVRQESSRENLKTSNVVGSLEGGENDRTNKRRPINRGVQSRPQSSYRITTDHNAREVNENKFITEGAYQFDIPRPEDSSENEFHIGTQKPSKKTNEAFNSYYQTNIYQRDSSNERQVNSVINSQSHPKSFKTDSEQNLQTNDALQNNAHRDEPPFDSVPSKIQCTANCTEKQTIRVRPTSYDIQTTPGITRGNSRHRGSLTYTVSPNEAEPVINRGTPAVSRARPTLKPSTSIVSKASEYFDIYRFPPRRPESVYPTPQVDKTAAKCRRDVCLLPDCFCGGKDIPGELSVEQTPQIVLLTFDDSVNDLNKGLYSDLFEKGRTNPNGCPIAGTFYVSHEWTDYSQVQNLYSAGHEIASHSVSHSFGEQFSQKKWTREIAGQREILAAYGGVKQEDIRGMRAPFLAVGGNKMFKMLYDSNFTYDSSMPVYENKPPSWPYTLDYKIFHDCMIPPCPTRSYPGVWEVPMVMWQDLNGGRCSMGDACSNPPTSDGVYKMLIKNFERHFTSNRAPFGLFYHAAWFTQPHHKEGFIAFLDTIVNMPEVWLITNWQAIQWVRDPTPISRLNSFAPFQCNYPDRPKKCNNPKVCNLWHKSGVRYMRTCQACPEVYPWTGKTGVRNSRVDNEIFQE